MKNDIGQKSGAAESTKQRRVEYTVRIGNHLYQRITRHLILLKHIRNSESKQKWIQEAIKEKIASDAISKELAEDRFLHIKMELDLWEDLQKIVESHKSTRRSASKKIFIEEAILEKLDREEHKSKALLKNMLNLSTEE